MADVLNRYPDWNNKAHTVHVMKYLFPRQFGLHNAFTSVVDPKETVQPVKDYTLREPEIAQFERRAMQKIDPSRNDPGAVKQRLPKRLRGKAFDLVKDLQKFRSRCSYHELFKHYCPRRPCTTYDREKATTPNRVSPGTVTQSIAQLPGPQSSSSTVLRARHPPAESSKLSFISLATPHSNVSAFCRAVLSKVIPSGFWGDAAQGQANKMVVMQHVDRFIRLRRFESTTLHVVYQDLKVCRS